MLEVTWQRGLCKLSRGAGGCGGFEGQEGAFWACFEDTSSVEGQALDTVNLEAPLTGQPLAGASRLNRR